MLKRYWFIVYPQDRFGPANIGATAHSKVEALSLIFEIFSKNNFTNWLVNLSEDTESIEDIDVRLLDQNHVVPNMGVVTWRGVWWPNLNH